MSAGHAPEGHDAHVEAHVEVNDAHGKVKAHVEANDDAVEDIFNGISKIASGVKKGVMGVLGPLWNGLKKFGGFLEKKLGLASKAKGSHDTHSAGHGDNHGHGETHSGHDAGHDDKHDDHGHGAAANDNHGHGEVANDNHGHDDKHGHDDGHNDKKHAAGGHH